MSDPNTSELAQGANANSVQRLVRRLVASGKRMVIAIDSKGVHFRETLCVTHDGDSGESRYDTKPIGSLKHPRKFRASIARMLKSPNTDYATGG